MRVAITGGTGFVGSHTVRALVEAGHDVKLLVRSRSRLEPALRPHGLETPAVVVGDVTDRRAVEETIDGSDALLHAANVFSFDPRRADEMGTTNARSTELILDASTRAGLDPIIHVSSFVALLPAKGRLTPESDVGSPAPAYSRSKAAAERIARSFQEDGSPVVITYPGSVWGPDDPHFGESNRLAQRALRGRFRLLNAGPLPVTDVRDVAAAHAAVMEAGRGPRRYVVVGHSPSVRALIARLGEVSGRNLWSIRTPAQLAMATGRAADRAGARFGVELSLNHESPWLLANGAEADSTETIRDLGIRFTALDTTLADTVRWLYRAGHITRRQAGALAD